MILDGILLFNVWFPIILIFCFYCLDSEVGLQSQGRISRGIHGLPEVSLRPAMP
jgi:hypothetical protein